MHVPHRLGIPTGIDLSKSNIVPIQRRMPALLACLYCCGSPASVRGLAGSSTRPATAASAAEVRYRARVAYDGHGYEGFQLLGPAFDRGSRRTVQGVLEEALHRRFAAVPFLLPSAAPAAAGERLIKVVAAGRTDAGVHARGQAIHFDLHPGVKQTVNLPSEEAEELSGLCDTINKMLPPDVRIWNLQRAPDPVVKPASAAMNNDQVDFDDDDPLLLEDDVEDESVSATRTYPWNVMYETTGKLYSYRLSLAPVMDPLERRSRWHPVQATSIDPDRLASIVRQYEGSHDFRAFAGSTNAQTKERPSKPRSTVRTVYSVNVVHEPGGVGGNYRIDFHLKGAMYKQVRNMVGTALDVCTGKVSAEQFQFLLHGGPAATRSGNRSTPAPPEGLTLEHVFFDDY
jgi:tRNA pseudouridine38-40 synthase